MENKDKKAVVILIVLILAVFFLLVYFIRKSGKVGEGKTDIAIPTESTVNVATPSLPVVPGHPTGQPTSSPTPTPLLALNITPIVPEKKPTTGVREDETPGKDAVGEEIAVQEPLEGFTWSEEGFTDLADLYALADFVAMVYSEQTGVSFVGLPVTEKEYNIFERPYAYYVDKYGFLHVNVRVTATGYNDRYISGVIGYYGAELAVYEVEVIEE